MANYLRLLNQVEVLRYDTTNTIITMLDPFEDVKSFLSYFMSQEFVVDNLMNKHGASRSSATTRAKKIIPHIKIAKAYIDQSSCSNLDTSFLPLYYAILNLMKVVILAGPYHSELEKNRWHGAQYEVNKKDSNSLMTEQIKVHKGGALPLYYKTITGKPIKRNFNIKVKDFYPCVSGVSAEYKIATGEDANFVWLRFYYEKKDGMVIPYAHALDTNGKVVKASKIGLDKQFIVDSTETEEHYKNILKGKPFPETDDIDDKFRMYIKKRHLMQMSAISREEKHDVLITYSNKSIEFFEELPIVLMFFHLSSVVRYKPEFYQKIKDSKYWPILSASRNHCMFVFMKCFWSYMNKENLSIKHA